MNSHNGPFFAFWRIYKKIEFQKSIVDKSRIVFDNTITISWAGIFISFQLIPILSIRFVDPCLTRFLDPDFYKYPGIRMCQPKDRHFHQLSNDTCIVHRFNGPGFRTHFCQISGSVPHEKSASRIQGVNICLCNKLKNKLREFLLTWSCFQFNHTIL